MTRAPAFPHTEKISEEDAKHLKMFENMFNVDSPFVDGGPGGVIVFETDKSITENKWSHLTFEQAEMKEIYLKIWISPKIDTASRYGEEASEILHKYFDKFGFSPIHWPDNGYEQLFEEYLNKQ